MLIDSNGIARGKIIRRHELMSLYTSGRHMPVSILGLDICGEDVDETGLIWEQGDQDLRAWPMPGSLVPLHGTKPPRGEVLMSLYLLDGRTMDSDPRHALRRQVDAMADEGLYPAAAFELEFFLLDNERDADGALRPARAVLDGRRSDKTEVYSVDHLHGMEPLFSEIYAATAKAGITAETVISEYAPGQYEMTLHYRRDVMQAADDLVRLKRIVRMTARRFGVTACFMSKPVENCAGSGMHFHVSLQDKDGANLFAEAVEGEWNETLLHALGGLRATMARGDAGLCAPCKFLAALRQPELRAGLRQLGREQPLGRPAGACRGDGRAPDRASALGRGRQPLPRGRDDPGGHPARAGASDRPRPADHRQWL